MLDRFVNQVQSSTNPSLDSLKKLAGMDRKKQIPDERNIEPEFTEQDGLLATDIAKRMLKWHAEAIGRAVELSPHSELYIFSFFPRHTNNSVPKMPRRYSISCSSMSGRPILKLF